jgi:hypothetical protein
MTKGKFKVSWVAGWGELSVEVQAQGNAKVKSAVHFRKLLRFFMGFNRFTSQNTVFLSFSNKILIIF